jgi:hypothetical protein
VIVLVQRSRPLPGKWDSASETLKYGAGSEPTSDAMVFLLCNFGMIVNQITQ